MSKKTKGLNKAIEKFNNWPGTARIYYDAACGRIWTETFVGEREGRYQKFQKDSIIEVFNKEGLYTEDITISEEALLKKIDIELEEFDYRKSKYH